MMNGLLFIFPLYHYKNPGLADAPWINESVRTYIPLFIIAAVITILPMIAIFFFKDRKRQKGMVWLSIISIFGFISVMMMRAANLQNSSPPITDFGYMVPGVLVTIAALVFLILALQGIRRDDKLIKSLDRLR
jgi:hypothetical protein